jgi:uncharacterized lipoprotein YmbA
MDFARSSIISRMLVASTFALVAGCNVLPEPQPDTVRYFTLGEPFTEVKQGGVRVRPVQLAGHLRNRAMAVRVDANEVIYLEDVRWAESLDDSIAQLLRARLSGIGEGKAVSVQVQRCEVVRANDGAMEFAATYTIQGEGRQADVRGAFVAPSRRWDGKDYGALVSMMRDAVKELGDRIARDLSG